MVGNRIVSIFPVSCIAAFQLLNSNKTESICKRERERENLKRTTEISCLNEITSLIQSKKYLGIFTESLHQAQEGPACRQFSQVFAEMHNLKIFPSRVLHSLHTQHKKITNNNLQIFIFMTDDRIQKKLKLTSSKNSRSLSASFCKEIVGSYSLEYSSISFVIFAMMEAICWR